MGEDERCWLLGCSSVRWAVSASRRSVPSSASSPKLRVDDGDDGGILSSASELELETATRLSSSVARRFVFVAVSTPEHELDVVIDGSVAQALRSRGREGRRLLLLFLGLEEDSLRGTWPDSGDNVAIFFSFALSLASCTFLVRIRSLAGS